MRGSRQSVLIIGCGRLGKALARRLSVSGFIVQKICSRKSKRPARVAAGIVWFCVPDSEIERVADQFSRYEFAGKIAFHSSGVLSSDVLHALRSVGASVASVHPLMTFVAGSIPRLQGVPFAIEGDRRAIQVARWLVHELGGTAVKIDKGNKAAYHAFATMICPLLVSLLAASEQVAQLAGISGRELRRRMMPIVRQTLENYERLGAAGAFSGPIVRGDAKTVQAHLNVLRTVPASKHVYAALARAALAFLPSRDAKQIANSLNGRAKAFNRRVRKGG